MLPLIIAGTALAGYAAGRTLEEGAKALVKRYKARSTGQIVEASAVASTPVRRSRAAKEAKPSTPTERFNEKYAVELDPEAVEAARAASEAAEGSQVAPKPKNRAEKRAEAAAQKKTLAQQLEGVKIT